ncbi:hypothetical protein [Frankia sp. CiP1_Cm_nod1]
MATGTHRSSPRDPDHQGRRRAARWRDQDFFAPSQRPGLPDSRVPGAAIKMANDFICPVVLAIGDNSNMKLMVRVDRRSPAERIRLDYFSDIDPTSAVDTGASVRRATTGG